MAFGEGKPVGSRTLLARRYLLEALQLPGVLLSGACRSAVTVTFLLTLSTCTAVTALVTGAEEVKNQQVILGCILCIITTCQVLSIRDSISHFMTDEILTIRSEWW